jgi:hypothetical protein
VQKKFLGIDPGLKGAFVLIGGKKFETYPMPTVSYGKDTIVDFSGVNKLLWNLKNKYPVIEVHLERAVSFGMGITGAFNYGRGFAALEIAIKLNKLPVTYVEPGKWAKEMHQGITKDLKPKAKSLIAVERLFPHLVAKLPRNGKGKLLDGPVDALLIAAYAERKSTPVSEEYDFM